MLIGSKGNVKSIESHTGITFAPLRTSKSWPRGNRIAFAKEGINVATPTVVRTVLFALAIVALGFVPGVSGADAPSAKGKGDFMMNGNVRTFSFKAITRHNGVVTGRAKVHNLATGTVVDMTIDCLDFVAPNTVLVSGTIKKSNVSNLVGQTGLFQAQDNGKGSDKAHDKGKRSDEALDKGKGSDEADDNGKDGDEADDNGKGSDSQPDTISLLFPFPADSSNCLSDLTLDTFPLDHGNIKVRP